MLELFAKKEKGSTEEEVIVRESYGFSYEKALDKAKKEEYTNLIQELADTRKAAGRRIAELEAEVASLRKENLMLIEKSTPKPTKKKVLELEEK